MHMKCIFKYISVILLAFLAGSCKERYVTYDDAEYVMFADTLATYPVQKDVEWFSIPVVSTVTRECPVLSLPESPQVCL